PCTFPLVLPLELLSSPEKKCGDEMPRIRPHCPSVECLSRRPEQKSLLPRRPVFYAEAPAPLQESKQRRNCYTMQPLNTRPPIGTTDLRVSRRATASFLPLANGTTQLTRPDSIKD